MLQPAFVLRGAETKAITMTKTKTKTKANAKVKVRAKFMALH